MNNPIMPPDDPVRSNRFARRRFDFKIELIETDDETRMVTVLAKPDPRRYEKVEKDGKKYYGDKFLRELIEEETFLNAMAEQLNGLPLFGIFPSIKSAPDYVAARRSAVEHEVFGGGFVAPPEPAERHEHVSNNPQSRAVAFLSVDICGASALRRKDETGFETAHRLMIQEFATAVGQFRGSIMTLTGDGFIACVDHPSFTSVADLTVDLGITLQRLLKDAVNPSLQKLGLPNLDVRIGADFGDMRIRTIDVPTTGFSAPEIASDALNCAVKIQETCDPGEFRIGRGLREILHVQWLLRATPVPFDGATVGDPNYAVYKMI